MKVTVEIDCTPAEARQFFGLPNVEPMQAAMMTKLEKRMSEEVDRFSTEALNVVQPFFSECGMGTKNVREFALDRQQSAMRIRGGHGSRKSNRWCMPIENVRLCRWDANRHASAPPHSSLQGDLDRLRWP